MSAVQKNNAIENNEHIWVSELLAADLANGLATVKINGANYVMPIGLTYPIWLIRDISPERFYCVVIGNSPEEAICLLVHKGG